jgi:hypothetical protein
MAGFSSNRVERTTRNGTQSCRDQLGDIHAMIRGAHLLHDGVARRKDDLRLRESRIEERDS